MTPFAVAFVTLLSGFVIAPGALAQSAAGYPNKPITLVVPFVAGGSTDAAARTMGLKLSQQLGKPVVIENKAGGGSTIGTAIVAKAPPDGYTLLLTSISLAINAGLRPKLPYDTLKDLQPISQISSLPLVLVVNPNVPAKNVAEFVALAKAGKLNYASSGSGTSPHLAGEMFKTLAKVPMTHIPYKGNGPVLNDLLSGQVEAHFGLVPGMMPHIKSGKLRALAVTTRTRIASLPDVPTVAESGYPDFEINSWQGIFAPAGTPADIVAKLNEAIMRNVQDPEFKALLAKEGAEPVGSSVTQFTAWVSGEVSKWAKVVKESGAQPD